jgi:CheY-like chemotaxis protein
LKSIIESPPAIVITDHYMPEMSGYELVKQIKILDVKFKPPVIVLSSDITLAISEEYAELGVEFVFQKPVNLKSFKEALEISLKKAIYS